MLMNILFLLFVFILGLFSTLFSFPRKKILAYFHSLSLYLSIKNTPPIEKSIPDPNPEKNFKAIIDEDKVELQRVFATFDKNNDGYITKQELKQSLDNIGILVEEEDVADMVAKVDSNGDGLIDFHEFHDLFESMTMKNNSNKLEGSFDKESDLKEAFDVFDGDGDGLITVEELGLVLSSLGFVNEGNTTECCKQMISKVDIDGDGMVNFDEFKTMMMR